MVVRNSLRRLHIRFWHASSAKLIELLRVAEVPQEALSLVKEGVDTCRVCWMWTKPLPKSLTTVCLATDFKQVVQWDISFHRKLMVTHSPDKAARWTAGSILMGMTPEGLIAAIMTHWIRHIGPTGVFIAGGEQSLVSEEVAQFLARAPVHFKTKAPGEPAQMVDRHHELLRRLLLRVESQLQAEGLHVPTEVVVAECFLAKNVLTTVAGHTPYRAL